MLSVEAVVDEREGTAPAAAELRLHTKDCNALLFALEGLAELLLDRRLGEGASIGVDHLEGDLLAGEQRVVQELADVKDELGIGHFLILNNNNTPTQSNTPLGNDLTLL